MRIALHTAAAILLLTALYCGWVGATHIRPSDAEREYRQKAADVDAARETYEKDHGRLQGDWNATAAAALKANDGTTHQTAMAESLAISEQITRLDKETLMWTEKAVAAKQSRHTRLAISFAIAVCALPTAIFLFLLGRRGEVPRGPASDHRSPAASALP